MATRSAGFLLLGLGLFCLISLGFSLKDCGFLLFDLSTLKAS